MKLTPEQDAVRRHRRGSLIVSAGAGSGKTMTLVAHVMDRLTDPDDPGEISRLLIVTYTNAAAEEMKTRLKKELEKAVTETEDRLAEEKTAAGRRRLTELVTHLRKQEALLPQARVSTVDSFCSGLARGYFQYLEGVSPDFRICEENERKLLESDVLEEVLGQLYEKADPELTAFLDAYTDEKSDRILREMLLKLFDASESAADPDEWLKSLAKEFPASPEELPETPWMRQMEALLRDRLRELARRARGAAASYGEEEPYHRLFRSDSLMLEAVTETKGWEAFSRALGTLALGRKPSVKGEPEEEKDRFNGLRNRYKKDAEDLKKAWGGLDLGEELGQLRRIEGPLRFLARTALLFSARCREVKREKNLATFPDLEHFALRLLWRKTPEGRERTELARDLERELDEIIVDEYQDINQVQEDILYALSGEESGRPNLFMVGDVKQSIYRFRRAKPEIFLRKYKESSYKEGNHSKVDLGVNYRSRKEILDRTNAVFERLMDAPIGGVTYDRSARLRAGQERPGADIPSELIVLESKEAAEDSRALEAAYIADRIAGMIDRKEEVFGRESGRLRPVRAGDCAVLLRVVSGVGKIFADALEARGLSAIVPARTGFFDSPEIRTILSLLEVLDNPWQDIPLAAVLTAPFGALSDGEMALLAPGIRKTGSLFGAVREEAAGNGPLSVRLTDLLEQIARWREDADLLPVSELLEKVLGESGYGLYLTALPGGGRRKANAELLRELAEEFETTSYSGLYQFIRYVRRQQDAEQDLGEAGIGENADAVRIMSIHASKGLEFPVVFLADASHQFRQEGENGLMVHEGLGAALRSVDTDLRRRSSNLWYEALKERLKNEMLGEQLRLLYVGMTRAEERLIVSGTVKDAEKELSRYEMLEELPPGPLPAAVIGSCDSHLDLLLAAAASGAWPAVRIVREGEVERRKTERLREDASLMDRLAGLRRGGTDGSAWERVFGFTYPYGALSGLRGVYTVTQLKEAGQEELPEAAPATGRRTVRPAGAETGLTAAERGTAYHKVMERLPLGEPLTEGAAAALLADMEAGGLLTEAERAAVDVRKILPFTKGPLGERIRRAAAAGKVFREQPFLLGVPAREIYPDLGSEERILIQGIVDFYMDEPGGLVLIDYKTDRGADGETLWQRYGTQMDWYARALEAATGRKVSERYIFSLDGGCFFPG